MSVISGQEITEYVGRVHVALADLPPDVRRELLEDLPEHLTEVGAESTGSLIDRLGPPEAYAAELRAAAGLAEPADGEAARPDRAAALRRALADRLTALDLATGPLLGYARTSEFLRLLRPAWWVLRGYLLVLALSMFGDGPTVLPRLGGSPLVAMLFLLAAVIGSVWLGRRSDGLTGLRKVAVHGAGALLAVIGLAGLVGADGMARQNGYFAPSYSDNPYTNVQDLYVYDSEGRLVDGARIFDQNGRPIELGYPDWCPQPSVDPTAEPAQERASDHVRYAYPFCPAEAPFHGLGRGPAATGEPAPSIGPATPAATGPATSAATGPATPAATGQPTPAVTRS
ncbi:hypothetical protein ACFFWC_17430 [Plantactinospora siamensis]|uniref:Proline-rich protein n=1 Tax=Plantactinospora siamensis TaxID=555372 RepID=A0ABV6NPF0_9ACTN